MTRAPRATASWTAIAPTPPVAPSITSVSPSPTPPRTSNTRMLVSTATGRPAADSNDAEGGFLAQAVRIAFSAAAPPVANPNTSSPTATSSTPSPSASTTPEASRPSMMGRSSGMDALMAPLRTFQSNGFTPAASTAMRICPAPGCGSATSVTCRTSGPPYSAKVTAFMTGTLRLVRERHGERVAVALDHSALQEAGQRSIDQLAPGQPHLRARDRRPREHGQRCGRPGPRHQVRDDGPPRRVPDGARRLLAEALVALEVELDRGRHVLDHRPVARDHLDRIQRGDPPHRSDHRVEGIRAHRQPRDVVALQQVAGDRHPLVREPVGDVAGRLPRRVDDAHAFEHVAVAQRARHRVRLDLEPEPVVTGPRVARELRRLQLVQRDRHAQTV